MPELPEVATMVRAFRSTLIGRAVRHVVAEKAGLIEGATPEALRETLLDTVVSDVHRHGKYVRIDFDPPRRRTPDRALKRPPAPAASVVARRPKSLDQLLNGPAPGKAGRSRPATRGRAAQLFEGTRIIADPDNYPARASLLIHLKMTGRYFLMNDNGHPLPPKTRLLLAVEGRHDDLLFGLKDARRLARVWLLEPDEAHRWPAWLDLGPDALRSRLTKTTLARAVTGHLPIKLALVDQSRLAGLGNIYASEVLHRTRIHPERSAAALSEAEWEALAREIPALLKLSMKEWCETSKWVGPAVEGYGDYNGSFAVYGRAGEKCRRCGGEIAAIRQAGRSTYYCGGCQK